MRARVIGLFLVASLCGACDSSDATEAQSLRKKLKNGPVNNGATMNGVTLNGVTLNGVTLNGVTLNGVTLNGVTLNGVTLNGTQFAGGQWIDGVWTEYAGVDFVGAEFRIAEGGVVYTLKFNDIYKNPADPAGDVYFYDILVHDPEDQTWTPLCEKGGQAMSAIPVGELWDAETGDRLDVTDGLTFACRGYVIAKCVEFGYRPWGTATRCDGPNQVCEEVSLRDYHQACTRMIRADYCGDGTPHTVDGTLIDIYDPLSPQLQVSGSQGSPNWGVEAEWGPDGATCIGDSLRLQLLDDLNISYKEPECFADLVDLPDCGTMPASRGSLVGDSYCGAWGTMPGLCQ